jgi:acetylornithine deacetylase/succinyl-diaminopimelate desuccinylase-like protein
MDSCLQLLRDLVAIDSVNPSLVPGAAGESAVAARLVAAMRAAGLTVHLQEVLPGRPNVIGVLDGRARGPSLMFCGHTDTVGVEGMRDPFTPVEIDGRLYGRGSQDMKGGVAAMLDAARVVAAEGLPRGRLIVAAVVDEEYASIGADALVREWRADAAVVTEPTDLMIGIAHKGFAWLEVETLGRAAHGSRPADGRDAILDMGRVLQALADLERDLAGGPAHPLLGHPSLHASAIEGGGELSVYPASCRLQMERRTVPGEAVDQPRGELQGILDRLAGRDPGFRGHCRLTFTRPPYEIAAGAALPVALAHAAAACGAGSATTGMSFWTDAAVLGQAGIPSVLYGPGGAGLHSVEEYVTVADVVTCRDVLARLAREWCGTSAQPG